jgi:hypothetical protein
MLMNIPIRCESKSACPCLTWNVNVGPEFQFTLKGYDSLVYSGGYDVTLWPEFPSERWSKGYGIGADLTVEDVRAYFEFKRMLLWKEIHNLIFFYTLGIQYGPVIDVPRRGSRKAGIGAQFSLWTYLGPFFGVRTTTRFLTNRFFSFGIQFTTGLGFCLLMHSKSPDNN